MPTYSVILDDMKEEGSFSPSYYHKYRVIQGEKLSVSDWMAVPEGYYRKNENFLGMTILAKQDGKYDTAAGPPGYEYVGDSRYGNWQQDSGGSSFWAFYGKYALMSHLLGGSRIFRRDYSTYQDHRRQGRPYYGKNKEYGTAGSVTKSKKPNFYTRRAARINASKKSFSQRVNQRTGRVRTTSRSGSFRGGK